MSDYNEDHYEQTLIQLFTESVRGQVHEVNPKVWTVKQSKQ